MAKLREKVSLQLISDLFAPKKKKKKVAGESQ
jgi:hypothetical protein